MEYFAHVDEQGNRQTVKEHLESTARLCEKFSAAFGMGSWGYCCGLLHDIGKYSLKFQDRLLNKGPKVDHATAGAKLCWDKGGMYQFLSYCIAGHHAGLPDTGEKGDSGSHGTMMGRMKKRLEDYQAYSEEISIPALLPPSFQPVKNENWDFFFSMVIRMMYSCLVDADYLDTEQFMKGGISVRERGESIEILHDKLTAYVGDWLGNSDIDTVNGRRTEILKACLERGRESRGLFRLTVPTGGGKTIASLAFALRHAKEHRMDRVIYVIPYTSIIEQNAKVFSDILGEENVLENHCGVDYESNEELKPMQLAAENWDKPVIVTTSVQFFESLFSNKSSKCRKLHNMANSVIIFDEAQMLPNDYLKPCVAAMEQLVRYYGSSIVLCTATQPALDRIFAGDLEARELCPRMEEQFRFFKRVSFKNLETVSEEELLEKLREERQALCILNTKKRVQRIYGELKGEGVYHLSTSMYPVHRKRVLSKIRECLKNRERCVVITTSLVEAGVDLDFPTVYRQLAGVDSIVQAAGRCNREGKRNAKESITYVFQFQDREYAPQQRQQMEVTESLLMDKNSLENLETIQKYFEMLYHFRGEGLDKKRIMNQFQKKRFAFAKVGKEFHLIEENTKTVLITKEERAQDILRELTVKGATKSLIRRMGQYCVNIYENDFNKMYAAGMLENLSEDLKDYYVLRNPEDYSEEIGLELNVEYGQAVFF